MRILLILPADNLYRYGGSFIPAVSYAPLTLTTLAALVPPELRATIQIVDEGVQQVDYDSRSCDIVGITCVASSAPRAYYLANYWRARGATVLLGGAHPTLMPDEAARFADAVFIGFAEESFPRFFTDYLNGTVQRFYRHPQGAPLSVPVPRRDLLAKGRYLKVPTVIANRGCGNNCDFCSVPRLRGGGNAKRPIPEVLDEIRRTGSREILFLDPSPLSDREYARAFFEALIPLGIRWGGLATADVTADPDLFDLIVRSGCTGILIGFESLSQESLDLSGKRHNLVARYADTVRTLHSRSISVLGCFVLGYDGDTPASIAGLAAAIDRLGIDLPRYAILTPFPGTRLFDRLGEEGRILTTDWSRYDSANVVFQPAHLRPGELQQAYRDIWKKTYGFGSVLRRLARVPNAMKVLAASTGFMYLAYRGGRQRGGTDPFPRLPL